MTLNSVVLPAPLGPISPQIWPWLDRERRPIERHDPAEPNRDLLDVEDRARAHRRPRTRRRPTNTDPPVPSSPADPWSTPLSTHRDGSTIRPVPNLCDVRVARARCSCQVASVVATVAAFAQRRRGPSRAAAGQSLARSSAATSSSPRRRKQRRPLPRASSATSRSRGRQRAVGTGQRGDAGAHGAAGVEAVGVRLGQATEDGVGVAAEHGVVLVVEHRAVVLDVEHLVAGRRLGRPRRRGSRPPAASSRG